MPERLSEYECEEVLAHGLELRDYGEQVYGELGFRAVSYSFIAPDAIWQLATGSRKSETARSRRLATLYDIARHTVGLEPVDRLEIRAARRTFSGASYDLVAGYMAGLAVSLRPFSPATDSPEDKAAAADRYDISDTPVGPELVAEFMDLTPDDLLMDTALNGQHAESAYKTLESVLERLATYHGRIVSDGSSYGLLLKNGVIAGIESHIRDDCSS